MRNFPPTMDPAAMTITATIIANILSEDLTIVELNALAGWLGLIAENLAAIAAQKLLDRERIGPSTTSDDSLV